MRNIKLKLCIENQDFYTYDVEGHDTYEYCEVQFDDNEFNGKMYCYVHDNNYDDDEDEHRLSEEDELYDILRDRAIADYTGRK